MPLPSPEFAAWLAEAERLIEDYAGARAETAVFNVTQQSGMTVRLVRPRLRDLLKHLDAVPVAQPEKQDSVYLTSASGGGDK